MKIWRKPQWFFVCVLQAWLCFLTELPPVLAVGENAPKKADPVSRRCLPSKWGKRPCLVFWITHAEHALPCLLAMQGQRVAKQVKIKMLSLKGAGIALWRQTAIISKTRHLSSFAFAEIGVLRRKRKQAGDGFEKSAGADPSARWGSLRKPPRWSWGFLAAQCTHTHPSNPVSPGRVYSVKGKKIHSSSENITEAFRALLWVMISAKICQDGGAPTSPSGPQRSQKSTAKPLSKAL